MLDIPNLSCTLIYVGKILEDTKYSMTFFNYFVYYKIAP